MPKVIQKTVQSTSPPWAGTPQHYPGALLQGGGFLDASQFYYEDAVLVTASAAAADATTVNVTFSHPTPGMSIRSGLTLPVGTVLQFGPDKYATLTAEANPDGDTSIAVEALTTALAGAETAVFSEGSRKPVPSGILVGRTYAERTANTGHGPADAATPDDQIFLLAVPVDDLLGDVACELYAHGGIVYEDLLPGWSSLGNTTQAKIRELYTCIKSS